MQVTFFREANSVLGVNQDGSTNFCAANQKLEEDKGLTNEEKETYEKVLNEGKRVDNGQYKKLSGKEKEDLIQAKAKNQGEQNDGGLGSQYNVNQQFMSFPLSTILVPMMPQIQGGNSQTQVNNATMGSETAQESNQVHATNFLQLANGNFVIR
eukprot:14383581-Ditylum_brightwellii.AAC.1